MWRSGRLRVLVVEDNLDQVVTTALLLRTIGYEAEVAITGGAALATARRFRPDIVLLDVGLPDMMGWEIARELKSELRKVRIIAITGRSGEAERTRSIEAGCEAYLLKPVGPATLESFLAASR